MGSLDRDALTTLAGTHGWPAVSLYVPLHRAGSEKLQDRPRLKNLLRSAQERLVTDGLRGPEAEAFCAPVAALLADDSYWRGGADGLAVFVSLSGATAIRLDSTVPEQVVVGDRFYVRPLIAARKGDRRFYALAIDRGGCRLFRGDGASIDRVPLEGAPASLADELRFDETQDSVQFSSMPAPQSAAQGGRPNGAIFHGHGGEKDTDKLNLERYLRKVETAVSRTVACESGVPLVLMGVDYEIAMYRSLTSCAALVAEQVTGATDELTPYQVHKRALAALEPRFAAELAAELAHLGEHEGSSLVSHSATEIVAAAAEGRVAALFFDDSVGPFGVFDRQSHTVEAVCADAPRFLREGATASMPLDGECGWDLIDLAAAETALHGGEVHAFVGEDAPVHGVAALMRY